MLKILRWLSIVIVLPTIAISLVLAVVLWTPGGDDPRRELLSRRGAFSSWRLVDERMEADGSRVRDIEIEDDLSRKVELRLLIPDGELTGTCLFLLGGLETGKKTVDYLGLVPGCIVVGMDYPYAGKKRSYRPLEFIRAVPAIREALLTTPGAVSLSLDYLERTSCLDRGLVLIGGSLGALFVPSIAGMDERVSTLVLLFGAGDLAGLLEENMRLADYPFPLPLISGCIAKRVLAPLEPVQYMKDMAGRRVFMVNGSGDPRMPRPYVEKLYRSIGGSRELRWLDVGHVHIRNREFAALVGRVIAEWLLEQGLIPVMPPGLYGSDNTAKDGS